MNAWTRTRYGGPGVLSFREVPAPAPGAGEVAVRVRAASVNAADRYILHGRPRVARVVFGIGRPNTTRLGCDFAGEVESVGPGASRFRPGDRVFGSVRDEFKADIDRAFGERVVTPGALLAPVPEGATFAAAAALPTAGMTALRGIEAAGARIGAGARVLVTGATGGVGGFAVQLAAARGAEVAAVCSAEAADLARANGASRVIDRAREDWLGEAAAFDAILDVAAARPLRENLRALRPGGVYVHLGSVDRGGYFSPLTGVLLHSALRHALGDARVRLVTQTPEQRLLAELASMLAAGTLRPALDSTFALADLPRALDRFERRGVRGKILVEG
ncbi:MAG: NAD(P)-dependent alcohol dehydrogenase [Candidatus Sumerlaeia bacterium]|nr:NAD(P)-dependent alcohol dehydrogenase [Candidatus Sumerlaeia bacterium]